MAAAKLHRWVIAAATLAALAGGGYRVGEWSAERGYPVIREVRDTTVIHDTTVHYALEKTVLRDTVWFSDSTELADFALDKSRLGSAVLR